MIIGLIIVFALICFVVDLATRSLLERLRTRKRLREREEALAVSLKLDFSREAKSLKRVEVEKPVARILCVDDEEIILDSFRKILVLDGYSVDTVQVGQEALGLLQTNHYDFVFTDLRMPAMDGLELTKAVKHMRPDIDVIIITGYATVETAVECMKYGAMDYVQKPFTEEELRAFVKKALLKRLDTLEKRLKPSVHITHHTEAVGSRPGEFIIPGGVLISRGHCWSSLSQDGLVRVGMDDFAKKLIGRMDGLDMPRTEVQVRAGQPLFSVRQGTRKIQFFSPVSGRIVQTNLSLTDLNKDLETTPYHTHWICVIVADNLDQEIPSLKIGKAAVTLFHEDIGRFKEFMREANGVARQQAPAADALCIGAMETLGDAQWDRAAAEFFGSARGVNPRD